MGNQAASDDDGISLTKILTPASFVFRVIVLCISEVEARPLRVVESKNVKGSMMTQSKGKVAEARAGVFRPTSWLLWLNPQDCHREWHRLQSVKLEFGVPPSGGVFLFRAPAA